jgi:hypothetical protein
MTESLGNVEDDNRMENGICQRLDGRGGISYRNAILRRNQIETNLPKYIRIAGSDGAGDQSYEKERSFARVDCNLERIRP